MALVVAVSASSDPCTVDPEEAIELTVAASALTDVCRLRTA